MSHVQFQTDFPRSHHIDSCNIKNRVKVPGYSINKFKMTNDQTNFTRCAVLTTAEYQLRITCFNH